MKLLKEEVKHRLNHEIKLRLAVFSRRILVFSTHQNNPSLLPNSLQKTITSTLQLQISRDPWIPGFNFRFTEGGLGWASAMLIGNVLTNAQISNVWPINGLNALRDSQRDFQTNQTTSTTRRTLLRRITINLLSTRLFASASPERLVSNVFNGL